MTIIWAKKKEKLNVPRGESHILMCLVMCLWVTHEDDGTGAVVFGSRETTVSAKLPRRLLAGFPLKLRVPRVVSIYGRERRLPSRCSTVNNTRGVTAGNKFNHVMLCLLNLTLGWLFLLQSRLVFGGLWRLHTNFYPRKKVQLVRMSRDINKQLPINTLHFYSMTFI